MKRNTVEIENLFFEYSTAQMTILVLLFIYLTCLFKI